MEKTTIRVTPGILENLKLLKGVVGAPSYAEVIRELVHTELCKTHAFTKDGYAPIGSVVKDKGTVLVVKSIQGDRVIFDDGSYTINGGGGTWHLSILAETVESFNAERLNHD